MVSPPVPPFGACHLAPVATGEETPGPDPVSLKGINLGAPTSPLTLGGLWASVAPFRSCLYGPGNADRPYMFGDLRPGAIFLGRRRVAPRSPRSAKNFQRSRCCRPRLSNFRGTRFPGRSALFGTCYHSALPEANFLLPTCGRRFFDCRLRPAGLLPVPPPNRQLMPANAAANARTATSPKVNFSASQGPAPL